MRRRLAKVALAPVALALAAATSPSCASDPPAPSPVRIEGSARYLERILLPPETELLAEVVNLTRSGILRCVVATNRTRIGSANPAAFSLDVPAAEVHAGEHYFLDVRLFTGGSGAAEAPWASATQPIDLSPGASPPRVEILLRRSSR